MHFLSRLNGLQSPKKYIERHYLSRYSTMYPQQGLYMRKIMKNFHCYKDNATLYESVIARYAIVIPTGILAVF